MFSLRNKKGDLKFTQVNEKNYRMLVAIIAVLLLINVSLVALSVFRSGGNSSQKDIQSPLEKSLGKHLILPAVDPTVVEIQDVDAVLDLNEGFYANASEGDIIYIYPELIILYRPSDDIIVNVSSITPAQ